MYLPSTSSFCDCSHGKCMTGCSQNCTMSIATLTTTCINDCTTTASGADCVAKCDECIDTYGCWTDADYGSTADETCEVNCYEPCATIFGAASDLCTCAHNACTLRCPSNCDPLEVSATAINSCMTRCESIGTLTTNSECLIYCGKCVERFGCWIEDKVIGSQDD